MEEYTLDGRLLTLLAQPLRIEEIRRAPPNSSASLAKRFTPS